MLHIADLHVRYGTTHAVRGVDLAVAAGESVALVGPNGAGKTSLLRAVSGLVRYQGSVSVDGEDLAPLAAEEIARRGVLHVPEGRRIFRDLTVEENLVLGTTARGGRAGEPVDTVYDLFPALAPLRRRLGFALSGGEQQMVAIGRALVAGPRLMLIDEPSLGLAPLVVDLVADALTAIRDRVSLLVIEQNVALARRLCERVVVLSDGGVVLEAPAARLGADEEVLASYLGRRTTGTGSR